MNRRIAVFSVIFLMLANILAFNFVDDGINQLPNIDNNETYGYQSNLAFEPEHAIVVHSSGTSVRVYDHAIDSNGDSFTGLFIEWSGSTTSIPYDGFTINKTSNKDSVIIKSGPSGPLWSLTATNMSPALGHRTSQYNTYVHGELILDSNDYLYYACSHINNAEFGSIKFDDISQDDLIIAKISSQGSWEWAKAISSREWVGIRDVSANPSGGINIAGIFQDNATIGDYQLVGVDATTSYSEPGDEGWTGFIAGISSTGTWEYAESISNFTFRPHITIGTTANGTVYVGGYVTTTTQQFFNNSGVTLNTSCSMSMTSYRGSFFASYNPATSSWSMIRTPSNASDCTSIATIEITSSDDALMYGYYKYSPTLFGAQLTNWGAGSFFMNVSLSNLSNHWYEDYKGSLYYVEIHTEPNSGSYFLTAQHTSWFYPHSGGSIGVSSSSTVHPSIVKISSTGNAVWGKSIVSNNAAIFISGATVTDGGNVTIGVMSKMYQWDIDEVSVYTGNLSNWRSAIIEFGPPDYDEDGVADEFDSDDDNDGVGDNGDSCQKGTRNWQSSPATDHDGDGCQDGDVYQIWGEDIDDDNDWKWDLHDDCPLGITNWSSYSSEDFDRDGCRDSSEDIDDDNDNVPDLIDLCMTSDFDLSQDFDGDGCDDADEDLDDDNDGLNDTDDDCLTGDGNLSSDFDADGCDDADEDTDDDNDGMEDSMDSCMTMDGNLSSDFDNDGCDDLDEDLDDDNDSIPDDEDPFPLDSNEWADTDSDGLGDNADLDDDNDGVPDLQDLDPFNPYICRDLDADAADDCSIGTDGFGPYEDFDTFNDGLDTDGDGLADIGDVDDDNDGVVDNEDIDSLNPYTCRDLDMDEADDCSIGSDGFGPLEDFDTSNDGLDSDGDGLADIGDADDDNDGVLDLDDSCFTNDFNLSSDFDGDGCDDLNEDSDDDNDGYMDNSDTCLTADGNVSEDFDTDGCDDADEDNDDDNDGILDNSDECLTTDFDLSADFDNDGCDDSDEDLDDDNDGYMDNSDAFPYDELEWSDFDNDGIGDNEDLDDDNDFVEDANDQCLSAPLTFNSQDFDMDGCEDNTEDLDDDNDGISDIDDSCLTQDGVVTLDFDNDGCDDLDEDLDDDNDGVLDVDDDYPNDPLKSVKKSVTKSSNDSLNVVIGIIILLVVIAGITFWNSQIKNSKKELQEEE